MKVDIPKAWLLKQAPREEGHEIGAGNLRRAAKVMPISGLLDAMDKLSKRLQKRKSK